MTGPLLLVGGGSGVVPLVSMIRHRRLAEDPRRVLLLYSARTWNDVIFRDELVELDARGDGFSLVLAVTRELPQRAGDFGRRVDGAMIAGRWCRACRRVSRVFVCGSNPFVNAAADGAVAAGVAAEKILTERYGV
jgi:ferredoxin-NADP reductase